MARTRFEDAAKLMDRYADAIGEAVTNVAQTAALAGGDYLAAETPVDTGGARSNWVATLDEHFEGVIPAYYPYPTYRPNHGDSVKAAVMKGSPRRVNVKAVAPGTKGPGVKVFGGGK